MAGNGPPPTPDSQRRRRNAPTFEWVALPVAGRAGPPPSLPDWRTWHPATAAWWERLWAKPEATQWDQDGSTLWVLAALYDDLITGEASVSQVSAEMRQHEDRHGLNPKARNGLRWIVTEAGEDADVAAANASRQSPEDRRNRMKVV